MSFTPTLLLIIAATTLAGCGRHAALDVSEPDAPVVAKRAAYPLVLTDLEVPNAPEGSVNQRGVIRVPVNRAKPSGQTIDIEFFRFKRLPEANPDTPSIFLLRGGPGYPGLGDTVHNPAFYKGSLQRYTRLADLIIVGQRGFGSSGDLSCSPVPRSALEQTDTSAKSRARYRKTSEICRDKYLDEGHDLSGYNIKEMAADVADIASALGYQSIQIKGNSFGSFWGMAVIRHHADLIARATFSALEGPDHTFDLPSAVQNVFTAIGEAAAKSERYGQRIPAQGLVSAFETVIEQAYETPIPASFTDEDTGESVTLHIDGDAIRRFLYGVTSRPLFRYTMHDWPEDLLKIIEGDLSVVAPLLYQYLTGTDADNAAEEIIECSSGISPQRRAQIQQDPALAIVGTSVLFDEQTCSLWGDAVIDMDRSDFSSAVPTVLIQGTWDISTPYDQATTVRTMFLDHHFVTVDGGSHGAIFEAEEADASFATALDHWYATGARDSIPEQVQLPELTWTGEE